MPKPDPCGSGFLSSGHVQCHIAPMSTEHSRRRGEIRIGISGWRYEPWRGVFYPEGLPQRRELEFASRMLPTIEINGSFYSLQHPDYYAQWRDETPDEFVFAVKAPKYITHVRRLKDVRTPLANFMANGLFELKDKLGPILWQFPPMLPFKADRFEGFFEMLPHDTEAAAQLAAEHDERVEGRMSLEIDRKRPLRHAVEIRHPSFADPAFIAMLRRHGIALVVADTAGKWPLLEDLTADFVYARLHGDKELYASGYSDEALARWATRFDAWSRGRQVDDAHLASPQPAPRRARRDIYAYFDNDVKVHAPYDAATLTRKLGLQSPLSERGAPAPDWLGEKPRVRAPGFEAPKKHRAAQRG